MLTPPPPPQQLSPLLLLLLLRRALGCAESRLGSGAGMRPTLPHQMLSLRLWQPPLLLQAHSLVPARQVERELN